MCEGGRRLTPPLPIDDADSTRPVLAPEILGELKQVLGQAEYLQLFRTLFGELQATAAALAAALERRDSVESERHAHSLVSVSGHMGALALADAARSLSKALRSHNRDAAGRPIPAELDPAAATVTGLAQRSIAALRQFGSADGA
jgi:HPt (histidine-containing phosphotransfer) domain-containing protein